MDTDASPDASALAHNGERGDRVHLVVPPSSDFLRTVRLVAADVAVRAGCDLDEVEDFRIAIDELCHLVMTSTDHFVHLSLTSFTDQVVGHGSARARSGNATVELDEVSSMIVKATTDHHRYERRNGEITFEVVKRVDHGWVRPGSGSFGSRA
jgi:serine/threonine-protein kinase RsbW